MFEKQSQNLYKAFKFWRAVAVFMFAVSVMIALFNAIALGNAQKAAEQAKIEYQVKLESAENMRDLAIDRLADAEEKIEKIKESLKNIDSNITIFSDGVCVRKEQYKSMGEYTITAYCACERCCGKWADGITASGLLAEPGIIAVDPKIIPLGSRVMIDGQEYLAADTGGAIKGNRIDIFAVSHDIALEYGVQNHEVYLVVQEEG